MKVRKIGLSKRILLILSILLLVGDTVIGAFVYTRMQSLFISKVQENAKNLSACAAVSVNSEDFAILLQKEDEEAYNSVLDTLSAFLDNSTLEYTYTFAREGDSVVFVVDADPEDPGEYWEDYGEITDGMEKAFNGECAVDEEITVDEWGIFVSAYSPIFDKNTGEVLGIVGVDVDYTEVSAAINRMVRWIVLICALVYIALLAALIAISTHMAHSFNKLNDKILELADGSGDLNKHIEITSGDEFEVIGDSINRFIEGLKNLILQVVKSSNENADSISSINDNTHSISASMEQCSASTELINSQLVTAAINVRELATEVEKAEKDVEEAAVRASAASDIAINHRKDSVAYIESLKNGVAEVKKQAEAVTEVSKINKKILSIVNATKILSMNAELEAGRAGEAGKGFEVVAKEVAQLSEDISKAVVEINDINEQVVKAMNDMVNHLDKVNEFMSGAVSDDYDSFAQIGRDYGETAIKIRDFFEALGEKSKELAATVDGVSLSVGEISGAVSDSASRVESLCGSTVEISEEISKLLENPIMKL
ncbi:MAG: methyl-accepting chemotaxis protein [Acetatifactor sp.]|nr:methyl-accepting chemotaxis protein [Acetatifactor sp.]